MFYLLFVFCFNVLVYTWCFGSDISTVQIVRENEPVVERNVYDPERKFLNSKIYRNASWLKDSAVASAEVHDYVASLQKRFRELPQYPIIIFDDNTIWGRYIEPDFTHELTEIGKESGIWFYTIKLQLQKNSTIEQKWFLGHELGHVAYRYSYPKEKINNEKTKTYLNYLWFTEHFFLNSTLGAGLAYLKNQEAKAKWVAVVCGSVYIVTRCVGSFVSSPCHKEELYCDAFAANTGINDKEKRDIIQSGIRSFRGRGGIELIINSILSIFTSLRHPANYTRINQYRRLERSLEPI